MVNDDPTNTIASSTILNYGDDTSIIDGKKLSAYSGDIYTVAVAPGITGGTVTADRSTAVTRSSPAWDNSEKVTLTLTPDVGNFLSAASWNDGTTDHNISASDLATAQSTGKWIFNSLSGNGGKTLTFTATFTPLAASITSGGTTTYFETLSDAFAAVPIDLSTPTTIVIQRDGIDESAVTYDFNDEFKAITIDLNGKTAKIGKIENKFGSLTITDSSTGHTGKAEFTWVENEGDVTIDGANVSMGTLDNPALNPFTLLLKKGATLTTDFMEWDSKTVSLENGSHWTAKGWLDLGYVDGVDFIINDRNSWVQLVDCSLYSIYAADHLRALLTPLAPTGTTFNINDATKNNFVLRKTWSLDLQNAFNEISAGVPSATVQYFDAVAGFDPTDPTTFNPADYVPAGETGANEITAINNSDGADHYIIMHILPHEGNPLDTEDPDYWTDERLLYVMEGASAASRSRGPGISLNLPYLLKADDYDANKGSTPADMQPRHDGAGWYYYKLPASHCVANGYTKSTLQGLAAPVFDMETVSLAQDLETGVVTLSRTTDTWTAELTYDRLHWPFTGTIDDTDKPILKKLVIKYGGSALITLDTTPASESASDVAKAAAAQAEIEAQITHNFGQATLEWNQQQIGSATAFGWFKRYSDDSYFWIDVPFTPLDPTEATYPAGTANNPWLIQNGADLSMLAKCVNIGYWKALERHLRQTADIDLTAEGVTDFEPIALTSMGGGFQGNYDGQGYSISHIYYTCTQLPDADGTKCYVGLFGQLFGMSDGKPGSVKNVTLKDCEFKADAGSCAVAVGTIAGAAAGMDANSFTVSGCKVLGSTVVSGPPADCYSGAIIGDWYSAAVTVKNNYYGYNVSVTNAGGTVSGYTPRGYTKGTYDDVSDTWSYEWKDVTANDGAVLFVMKASLGTINKPTGSTSTIAFSQTTTPANADATHPADCYKIIGTDYYYGVDQPVTISVTPGSVSPDGDIRTFYDELETLTVSYATTPPGTTTPVTTVDDITATLSFAMPVAEATISASFTPSKWFTIPSNGKELMSFYHEWKDDNGDPANYKVTAYSSSSNSRTRAGSNPLELLTIKKDGIDLAAGTATTLDLEGISYYGVPTLFHQEGGLPEKLRFDAEPDHTPPQYDAQFIGGVSDLSPYAEKSVFMLFNSELVRADLSDDKTVDPHRAFVVAKDNPATSRLRFISDDATGIQSIDNGPLTLDDADGAWYSIDGRKLQGKPTKRGLYIMNGKKVIIK